MARRRRFGRKRRASISRRYGRARRGLRRGIASNKFITMLTGAGSLIQQVTEKDFAGAAQQGIWNLPETQGPVYKLKFIAQHLIFRFTGMKAFSDTWLIPDPTQGVKVNPGGIMNKWTGLGALMTLILPRIPKLPYKGKIRAAGAGMLFGGIIGGLFDDPVNERMAAASPQRGPSVAYNRSVWTA